jgi:hypothetical protein
MTARTGANRPWYADREEVLAHVEQERHTAELCYLNELAGGVDTLIAYTTDDPATAARSALDALDASEWDAIFVRHQAILDNLLDAIYEITGVPKTIGVQLL